MTHTVRYVTAIASAAVWVTVSAWAQGAPQGHAHDEEAHHVGMLARGAQAMGFDQERTVHHFRMYEDGGAIDVAVREAGDHATLHAVRQHLRQIAGSFTAGDFSQPAFTHAQQVPGTEEMTRLRDRISYQYEDTPAGGQVRIVTRDTNARLAVHAFLRFQIEDHRTGDSGRVEGQQSSAMMHGMGLGRMAGPPDGATRQQMGDIHQLFLSHDRITRTVTNIPDGVRTVTESADPRVAQLLKDHVTSMRRRVDAGDDAGLPIASEALRSIFQNADRIHSAVEFTTTGVIVVQTSEDPDMVAALQQHAAEVSDFVEQGMAAMHRAMMQGGRGMMQGSRMMAMMPAEANPR